MHLQVWLYTHTKCWAHWQHAAKIETAEKAVMLFIKKIRNGRTKLKITMSQQKGVVCGICLSLYDIMNDINSVQMYHAQ